ncbi:iron-containing alcohol dehydrogenase, partial [Candidatus Aerophobetes bacterium]|nr:iron-containing alcohol dehydrogenase [Candidatus Aerophobetes bacterium]
AHGVTNALLLPYVMQFNAAGDTPKFAHIAELLGEDVEGLSLKEAAKKAALAARELALDIGIPKSLKEFGCREEDAPHLAEETFKIQRILVGNPRRVTLEDLEKMFDKAIQGEL